MTLSLEIQPLHDWLIQPFADIIKKPHPFHFSTAAQNVSFVLELALRGSRKASNSSLAYILLHSCLCLFGPSEKQEARWNCTCKRFIGEMPVKDKGKQGSGGGSFSYEYLWRTPKQHAVLSETWTGEQMTGRLQPYPLHILSSL